MNNISKYAGIGAAMGVVLGAITNQWWWIGIAAGIGAGIGVAFDRTSK